jgi:acetyl-CoA acetyltransferase
VIAGCVNQFGAQSLNMAHNAWLQKAELDELAPRSHRLAHSPTENGAFARQIARIHTDGTTPTKDHGIRPDTGMEALAALRPVFSRREDHRRQRLSDLGLRRSGSAHELRQGNDARAELPRPDTRSDSGRLRSGQDARRPISAIAKLLERNRLAVGNIDYFGVNEPFAPSPWHGAVCSVPTWSARTRAGALWRLEIRSARLAHA